MKRIFVIVLLAGSLVAQIKGRPDGTPAQLGAHANCRLCMCHAKDETKCSGMCIRLQRSEKIVEEPQMVQCTAECKRVHVKTV